MLRPRIFVASSIEARSVADDVGEILDDWYDVEVWSDGFFQPGSFTYESLAERLRDFDGGIFVLTPDDAYFKGEWGWTARPNVVFELGVFAGVLGIGNCLQLRCKVKDDKRLTPWKGTTGPGGGLPPSSKSTKISAISDLEGITYIEIPVSATENDGRTKFSLDADEADRLRETLARRWDADQKLLSPLRASRDLVSIWYDAGVPQVCKAELVVFGERVRIRQLWAATGRTYDVSLRMEAEDRLSGMWWDSGDRGYAGHASFQVRSRPAYLLGKWAGWSSNGGVNSGVFLVVDRQGIEAAEADRVSHKWSQRIRRRLLKGLKRLGRHGRHLWS